MPSFPQSEFLFCLDIRNAANTIYASQGFLTDSDIKEVWSKERFDQILSLNTLGFPPDCPKDSRVSFLTMRSKILLTLIEIGWSEWKECYQILLGDKRRDEALPLARSDLEFLKRPYAKLFHETQWQFNPPKLKEHLEIERYDRGTKLPFIEASTTRIGKGSSGVVTRESIPAGYWEDHNGQFNTENKLVARKSFRYAENDEIIRNIRDNEIRNLQSFRASRSTHRGIMNCLAYVIVEKKVGEGHSIIMDEAYTDLQHYLPYEKAMFLDDQTPTLRDLLTEAAELAGALEWLHKDIQKTGEILACCHMDLRPNNILIFLEKGSPVGIWKIADFGISAIRTPMQVLGKSNDNQARQDAIETIVTTAKRKKGPYTAPELSEPPNKVGRNSDIWSYGCILVDVIASKLTGEASLLSLTEKRRKKGKASGQEGEASSHSNDHFYRDKALNKYVRDWIDGLEEAGSETDHLESVNLSDCKKLLNDILVVEPHRPRAQDIRKRLINALKPVPASKSAPSSSMTEPSAQ